ncbi:hypothetical protein B0H13DRAFT_2435253 [Mycena leptocephala]|nr:hypothetical protein B0H13DRAFT_2435253 [Mycena leptocephala]
MSRTFGQTVSGGIQDISAVLSLLAITPISIFGSLGVAKAAFTIMFASLPHIGAKRLQHVGFDSTGDAVRMITLKGQCYVAELCLQELLKKHFIRDVQGLGLKMARAQFLSWNLWLMISSLVPTTSIAFWDESIASEVCLSSLNEFLHKQGGLKDTSVQQPFIAHLFAALKQLDENLGAFGCFGFAKELDATHAGFDSNTNALVKVKHGLKPLLATSWLYRTLWFAMLVGFGMIVLGYIGCFSIVQDPRSTTTDIYTWLGLEFALALIRMGIWGGIQHLMIRTVST